MEETSEDIINLQLGDIIHINIDETDEQYLDFNNDYFINYIDENKINLIDTTNSNLKTIILQNGKFQNIKVNSIDLLSRAKSQSYAIQNNLLPGIWVNIYFSGETPFILTGKITDLEEDMIEITNLEDDVFYIDFAYKGLPENLPIEKIQIRDSPSVKKASEDPESQDPESQEPESKEKVSEKPKSDEPESDQPESDEPDFASLQEVQLNKITMKENLLEGNQIDFGSDLDEITLLVDVDINKFRYALDKQTNDLLEELLSKIPNFKRTPVVINEIHTIIERFIQLRESFSVFDENKNIKMPTKILETDKPILNKLINLDTNIDWLIPVSIYKKNIYFYKDLDDELNDSDSINLLSFEDNLNKLEEILENYKNSTTISDENKYISLFRKINPYYIPYTEDENSNSLTNQQVGNNIFSILNNLDDFDSVVSTKIKSKLNIKKYFSDTYTTGNTYLKDDIITNLTSNDQIKILSYLKLSLPFIINSQSKLPFTNILDKAEINQKMIYLFDYFKNPYINTKIISNTFEPDSSDPSNLFNIKFNSRFYKNFTEYRPDLNLLENEDKFKLFLEKILPTNVQAFKSIKVLVKNLLNINSIIKFLQIFYIDKDHISIQQYREIKEFLNSNILEYKSELFNNIKKFNKLLSKKTSLKLSKNYNNNLLKLIETNTSIETIILENYDFSEKLFYSNSEIINIITNSDFGTLFINSFNKINHELFTTDLIDTFVKKYETEITEKKALAEATDNNCGNLSKKYYNISDLENDNDKEYLNYDKEYNNTEKDIQIVNGDYAILILDEKQNPKIAEYYKRVNNKWVKDVETTANMNNIEVTKSEFCNLKENCFYSNNNCNTDIQTDIDISKKTLDSIYKEFDETYDKNEQQLKEELEINLLKSINRIKYLRKFQNHQNFKYNNLKLKIAELYNNFEQAEIKSSPYEDLRDLILGESDFIKKQFNIKKFVFNFTRKPLINEDNYWLYCIQTNVKLLPVFISRLANVFINRGDFVKELELICAEQGTISDDGDSWVDKYSGYTIRKIDYDNDEGFTEEGFKANTRQVLEMDLGDAVLEKQTFTEKLENPDYLMVENIVKSMSGFMGINISNVQEFIINNSLKLYDSKIPKLKQQIKSINKKSQEKGEKPNISLEEVKDLSLLIITLSYLLIGIQICIPSIKSKKTFPGCIRSFTGYPISGTDKSAITYIACVANKIKSSNKPWNSIKKMKEDSIIKRISSIIDSDIINDPIILNKFSEKIEFLKFEQKDSDIDNQELKKLNNFYPPLVTIKITQLSNINDSFKESLYKNILDGNPEQYIQIFIIKNKIINFGLSIQEKIQKIVEKNQPLLSSNSGNAFLENSCCISTSVNINKFILENDSSIDNDNKIVEDLSELDKTNRYLYKPDTFFDPTDTKFKYPELSNSFSQYTIYKAFVVFCQNKLLNFDINIRTFCKDNIINDDPDSLDDEDINMNKIDKSIKRLKESGINYSGELFEKLLQLVNSKNSLKINLYKQEQNIIEKLRVVLTELSNKDEEYIDNIFIFNYNELLDTFDLSDKENSTIRTIKNYLSDENNRLMQYILYFIKQNYKGSKSKIVNFEKCIKDLEIFNQSSKDFIINSKDETIFKTVNFLKNVINNLTSLYPNIVLNNVDFTNVIMPKYMNLSQKHILDIKEIVNKFYLKLRNFYEQSNITNILTKIQEIGNYIKKLSENTPFYSNLLDSNGDENKSIFDERFNLLIFKYYILKILELYIELSKGKYIDDLYESEIEVKKEFLEEEQHEMIEEAEQEESEVKEDIEGSIENVVKNEVSDYIISIFEIICGEKNSINYNYENIMEKILRSKEKEKDDITDYLKNLSDDERGVENIFKTQKLGKWSKGLQKGLTTYMADTYDEEREILEKDMIKQFKLGNNNIVTEMNREIYSLDFDAEEAIDEMIAEEENEMYDYDDEEAQFAHDAEYGEDYYNNDGY